LLEQQRAKLRQREEEFIEWVVKTPPIRLSGAAAIFTAATTGIPLGLTHHLKYNRVLHERVLLIATVSVDAPRVEAADRRRVMVIACEKASGMAVWRKSLFAMMHLNANLPAAYFGVPPTQVVEVGLEVEI
jgi:KUP system potassium uptake protein